MNFLCSIKYHAMKTYGDTEAYRIPNLGMLQVCGQLQALDVSAAFYRRGKSFFYPMDTSRNGCCDRAKYPCQEGNTTVKPVS